MLSRQVETRVPKSLRMLKITICLGGVCGDTSEWVDPLLQEERPWREAAEFTELGDHVRLVHIAKFGRQPGAAVSHSGHACQGRAKTGESTEKLRRQSDSFVEDASKVLAGDTGAVCEFGDGDDSTPLLHERREGRKVYCKSVIGTNVKSPEQRAFDLIDALFIAARIGDV